MVYIYYFLDRLMETIWKETDEVSTFKSKANILYSQSLIL